MVHVMVVKDVDFLSGGDVIEQAETVRIYRLAGTVYARKQTGSGIVSRT